ncbi:hypothetical protein [Amycolatopsis eburnea]|uniref:Uncharacterized protein n=1 Tax=Amycolatopsis eburnea TaxID=2267691 RepID=A0A427TGC5_9PSEU|nr:hypothetical protein [Amycolatopsis eburnea]RSD22163.1 hypothetical protein EIY87_10200 [Amycolatopsis eburnea]
MEAEIGFTELAALAGEVLPERAVLGLVGGSGSAAPAQYVATGPDGSTVYYACQTTHNAGTQGIVGATGLGQPPSTTTTCVPAVVTTR